MHTEQQKLGSYIASLRQKRGLTQKQFAKKLGTSQSAVTRMESGKQNMSVEMLSKIGDVLQQEIITLTNGAVNLRIEGGHRLSGEIETKVSKNAAVGLMCASLLNKGSSTFRRFPKIEEVYRISEVLESIGVKVEWVNDEQDIKITPPKKLRLDRMDATAAQRTRSIIMFMGPLIHLFDEFSLPNPGGCKLGTRTVRPHLYALENYGVDIKARDTTYDVAVKRRRPAEYVLYESGDTVTENAIMAASKMPGKTVLKMASANYMVQEVCFYLQQLGVEIEGIGTTTLTIHGVPEINQDVVYSPSEDPIESMLFLSAAIVTKSEITIKRCPIEFLELELLKLKKMRFKYDQSERYKADNGRTDLVDITTYPSELVALKEKIYGRPFPGINMDNLPFFVPIAAVAKGRTLIHDWPYENRAIYFTELNKLGAKVTLADIHRVYVDGPTDFTPTEAIAPPALRPAATIFVAMLAARGVSILRNNYSIKRGYEDLFSRLNSLGARIDVLREL